MTFQVGDVVRLKTGTAHQKVVRLRSNGRRMDTNYIETHHFYSNRDCSDFTLVSGKEHKTMTQQPTLYKVIAEKDAYGTFLVNNSEGQMVLEMKGAAGTVRAFKKEELEEVVPYTILVRTTDGNNQHYTATKGSVDLGDLLVWGTKMGQVQKLDTRQGNAQELPAKIQKVATTPLVA